MALITERFITRDARATEEAGERIAAYLKPGEVVALEGELGSGKTTIARGIARGLGVLENVTSPSFLMIHEYKGRVPVYHIDLYRIKGDDEVLDLGLEEYLYGEGISVLEWPEKCEGILPVGTIWIRILVIGDEEREIEVSGIDSPGCNKETCRRGFLKSQGG